MRPAPLAFLAAFALAAAARAHDAGPRASAALFEEVLASSDRLCGLGAEPQRYRLQLCFAEIVRAEGGGLALRRFEYRPDAEYWYPASTVKLAGAVAAVDLIEDLAAAHPGAVSVDAPLRFEPLTPADGAHEGDATNLDSGAITVRHLVRQALIVSDNPAFNRLYDLVGQGGLDARLRSYGLANPRIVHRLASARSPGEHRLAPAVTVGTEGVSLPARRTDRAIDPGLLARLEGWPRLPLGRAWQRGSEIVPEPFEMGGRNFIPLRDLLNLTAMIVRPDVDTGLPGVELSEEHRAMLVSAMSELPRQSRNPVYDAEAFGDYWAHFFLPGLERVAPRAELRVANKIGLAYGFSSETAYIEHTPTGRAFLLAMAVYTNDNAVLNDGVYEYDLAHAAMADAAEALARRVFEVPSGRTLAPAPFEHGSEALVPPGATPLRVEPGRPWTGEPLRGAGPIVEAVASWNATVPAGAGLVVEVRSRSDGDGAWAPWLALGARGIAVGPLASDQAAPEGRARVDVDTLVAPGGVASVQFRVRAAGGPVEITRLDAVLTSPADPGRPVTDERRAGAVGTPPPFHANDTTNPELAARLCSPLALRMLLAGRGVEAGPIDALAERVHDAGHDLYGVWPNAIQAASELGVPGRLHRFATWHEVRGHLERVGPVAISVRFGPGELRGAAYDGAGGHLMVLYGLDDAGDALVLDPAFTDPAEARRTYPRDDLSRVWLVNAKGLAYVLLDPRAEPEGAADG